MNMLYYELFQSEWNPDSNSNNYMQRSKELAKSLSEVFCQSLAVFRCSMRTVEI